MCCRDYDCRDELLQLHLLVLFMLKTIWTPSDERSGVATCNMSKLFVFDKGTSLRCYENWLCCCRLHFYSWSMMKSLFCWVQLYFQGHICLGQNWCPCSTCNNWTKLFINLKCVHWTWFVYWTQNIILPSSCFCYIWLLLCSCPIMSR